jgi:hypothetical protein
MCCVNSVYFHQNPSNRGGCYLFEVVAMDQIGIRPSSARVLGGLLAQMMLDAIRVTVTLIVDRYTC